MITVPNINILKNLKNKEPGEYAMTEDKRVYQYINEEWVPVNQNIGIDLYAINKAAFNSIDVLTSDEIEEKRENIIKPFVFNSLNNYFMYLSKENNYYTIFETDEGSIEDMSNVMIECMNCLGNILDIRLVEDNSSIEVWTRGANDDAKVGYIFPYDRGVIKCRK